MPDEPPTGHELGGQAARPRSLPPAVRAALVSWAAVPGLVLVLLGGGMRLSHNWPTDAGQWAQPAVLAVQLVLAGLIFPRLVDRAWSLVAAVAMSGPLIAAAGALSSDSFASTAAAWLLISLWLLVLFLLWQIGRRTGTQGAVHLLVCLVVSLAAALVYVAADGGGSSSTWLHRPGFGFAGLGIGAAGLACVNFLLARRRASRKSPPPDNTFSTIG